MYKLGIEFVYLELLNNFKEINYVKLNRKIIMKKLFAFIVVIAMFVFGTSTMVNAQDESIGDETSIEEKVALTGQFFSKKVHVRWMNLINLKILLDEVK